MHARRMAVIAAVILVVAISGLAFAAPVPTQEQNLAKFKAAPDNTPVAIIYNQAVTKRELMTALWDWMAPSTLDEYLNYKIITIAMKNRGIKVTQADIAKKMDEVKKTLPPGETLDSMMQKMKYPMSRFKAGMMIQIGLEKIIEKDNAPTAAEYGEYVKARHILISIPHPAADAKPDQTAKAEADAKAKAEKVLAEIKGGKSFDAAAKEYSDDPGSKEKGGDLGWFNKGRMVPEFSDAAFKMKEGEISEPVKSNYGYHIIQVTKIGKSATGADKAELKKMIMDTKSQQLMRTTFENLKNEAKVKNMLSPTLPEKKSPTPVMGSPRPMRTAPQPAGRPAPKTAPANGGVEAPPPAP
jgi:foldase protein PrsA